MAEHRSTFSAATMLRVARTLSPAALLILLAMLMSKDIGPAVTSAVPVQMSAYQLATSDLIDYDTDDDGLIEVGSLTMLDAIRWDLDGNGSSTSSGYASAFPTPESGMGCPDTGCSGYELTTDLDFDTNDDGIVDSSDDWWSSGLGWLPIGDGSSDTDSTRFNATFDGNGHTITNLYIQRSTSLVGLFGSAGSSAVFRRLGLAGVAVSGHSSVGALSGYSAGQIETCYSTGTVTGTGNQIGGLVGHSEGSIIASYSNAYVTGNGAGSSIIGGLAGVASRETSIKASYSTGSVTGAGRENLQVGGLVGVSRGNIEASYSTSKVTAVAYVGGLIGDKGGGTITNSYWDTGTSGRPVGVGSDDLDFNGSLDPGETPTSGVTGKTTTELRSPTGYTGIYSSWNISIDDDSTVDDPWDFGAGYNYPVLSVDFDGDSDTAANWEDFGQQREPGPVGSLSETLNNDGSIMVTWDAPADLGSATSVTYQYRASTDDGNSWDPGWTATAVSSYTFTPAPSTAYIVEVRASSGTAHPLGKTSSITTTPVTKAPDPTDATLVITGDTTSVSEGSSIDIRITLNQPAPTDGASVRWYVADGTTVPIGSATGDLAITESLDGESRYRAAIASGEREITVSIPTSDDTRVEPDTEYIRFVVEKVVLGEDESNSFNPTSSSLEFGVEDTDTISLAISAQSPVREGTSGVAEAGSSQVTITATSDPEVTLDRSVKVRVVSEGGTAAEGTDYTALDETASFDPGTVVGAGTGDSPSVSITTANPLQPIADSVAEPDETVVLKLTPLSTADRAYNLGAPPPSTTVTILDDDGATIISDFSIDDTSPMVENGGQRTFTVTLASAANSALSIPVNATLDGDNATGKLTPSCAHEQKACVNIGSGQTSGSLTISSTGDELVTGTQPVKVTLDLPEGVSLADGVNSFLSVDRLDDDHLTATLTRSGYQVDEGETLQVTVRVTAPDKNLTRVASLKLQTSASNPVSAGTGDYTALDHTITLMTGDYDTSGRAFDVSVPTTGDNTAEVDETFQIALGTGDNRVSLAGQVFSATITIFDDDRATTVSGLTVDPASIDEDSEGTVTITITLDGEALSPATFEWVIGGQGIDTGDFSLVAGDGAGLTSTGDGLRGTVTLAAGKSSALLTLSAKDDSASPIPESETLTFTLSSVPDGLAVPENTSINVAITDNDPVVVSGSASLTLWHGDTQLDQQTSFATEGDILKALVSLSEAQALDIRVPLSLPDGNDITGDLTGDSQTTPTIAIASGDTTGWVSFLVRLDQIDESDEAVTLGLGTPTYDTTRPVSGSIGNTSTADLNIHDVLVSFQTRNVTAEGGRQKLHSMTIDTGRNLASGDENRVDVTFSVPPGDLTAAWRVQGQTADLNDTLNMDGTRTITLTTGDIAGRTIVLDLYVTPGSGASDPLNPAITITSITVRDNDISKELVSAALAPNRAPNTPSLSTQTATEDQRFTYQFAEVLDPDGDMVTYTASLGEMENLPSWLRFDSDTRTFSGTPLEADTPNSHTIRITVRDASLSTFSTFTLNVAEVNDPPSSLSLMDQFAEVDEEFSYTIPAATDPEGNSVTYLASLDDGTSLPTWLTFNALTRTFSGTPGNSDAGFLTIKVTASDNATPTPGSTSSTFTLTVTSLIDYDTDDDGLIEVGSLTMLDAIRWDLEGNGSSTNSGYSSAFPAPQSGMGCPTAGCTGYELTVDLDFDTNGDGAINSGDDWWDSGLGWLPIGDGSSDTDATRFNATFNGNGHTISNLYIQRSIPLVGLFGSTGSSANIHNLALKDVNVTGQTGVGGLVGENQGRVSITYTTGRVSASRSYAGGLVGWNNGGSIAGSYSSSDMSGETQVGGLVGLQGSGSMAACYSTGSVSSTGGQAGGLVGENRSSITACYSTSPVTGPVGIGGLIGIDQDGTVSSSYWDTEASGLAVGVGSDDEDGSGDIEETEFTTPGVSGKTDVEMRTPTGYVDLYGGWNISIDGDMDPNDPWDFGAAYNYPVLKLDFDGDPDSDADWSLFGRQREPGPVSGLSASLQESGNIETAWNAPDDTGSGTLESYRYRVSYDGGVTWGAWTDTEATSYTLETEDHAVHSFQVRATSDAVHTLGAASRLGPPGPPDVPSLTSRDLHLVATWGAPAMDGGAAITGYNLQYRQGSAGEWTDVPLLEESRTITIDSLTNDLPYQIRVAAENVFGLGSYSPTNTASPVNSPPPAPLVESRTATELQPFSYVVDAETDPDGHQVSFSAMLADGSPLPSWLSFDESSRTFSGTPEDADTGSLTIELTATDDGTPPATAQATFTLTVEDVNQPPEPPKVENQRAGAGLLFTYTISEATDPDSRDTLSYSASLVDGTELPIWMGFEINELIFSGTASSGDAGTLNIVVKATDDGTPPMSSEATFTLEVIYNSPPSAPAVSDQTATEGEPLNYTFPASSDDDNHTITYAAVQADGSSLPGWLTFHGSERVFRGTPLELDSPKRHQIRVTATDDGWPTASSQTEFELWVPEVDSPPIAVAVAKLGQPPLEPGDIKSDPLLVKPGDNVILNGSRSYDPEGQELTYIWTQIANGATNVELRGEEPQDPQDPQDPISTFIAPEVGTLVFKLVVKDEYLFSDPDFVSITIEGPGSQIPPTPSFGSGTIREQTYWVGQDVGAVQLPAASGGFGTLSYTLSPALPSGLTFDPLAHTITGTPVEPLDRIQFTYTATDSSGSSASLLFYLSVKQPAADIEIHPDGTVTIVARAAGESDLTIMQGGNTIQLMVRVDEESVGSRLTLRFGPALSSLALVEFSGVSLDNLPNLPTPRGFQSFQHLKSVTITLRDSGGAIIGRLTSPASVCLPLPGDTGPILIMLRYDDTTHGWSILSHDLVTLANGRTIICSNSASVATFAVGYTEPLASPPTAIPTPIANKPPLSSHELTPTPEAEQVLPGVSEPTPTLEAIQIPPGAPEPTPTAAAQQVPTGAPEPTPTLAIPTPPAISAPIPTSVPTRAGPLVQAGITPTLPPSPTPSIPPTSPTDVSPTLFVVKQTQPEAEPSPPPALSPVEEIKSPANGTRIWTLIGIPIGMLILVGTFIIYRRSLRS